MDDSQDWFERVWEFREETLYPRLFGTESKGGIYTLTYELFAKRFDETKVDPRWMNHGVLVFPPVADTPAWRFVTSGLSNAWEADRPDPESWSGIGVEFVLQAPGEHRWALNVTLNILAYQLLLAAGRFEGNPRIIEPYHRVPLGGAIDGERSALTHLLVCPSPSAPEDLRLESGRFSLFQLVGVTDGEIQFARSHDGRQLMSLLADRGCYPLTDAARTSVV